MTYADQIDTFRRRRDGLSESKRPGMSGLVRYSIPRLYYLVTPAFILLDYFGGINVRVAVLDDMPVYKNLYYGFCVLCGVAVYFRARSRILVSVVETERLLVGSGR